MKPIVVAAGATILCLAGLAFATPASAQGAFFAPFNAPVPVFSKALAFDVSRPLRSLPRSIGTTPFSQFGVEIRPENDEGPFVRPVNIFRDPVVQRFAGNDSSDRLLLTFEGLSNSQNPFQVVPPDSDGTIGKNNYVEIVNLVFGDYDRQGHLLAGPTQLGTLWTGFPISDCTDNSGDPVALYDRKNDRWVLTQFTTRGPNYYNCVAVSQTGDPAGSYYRYAFSAGPNFPDYPKYGDWSDSYLLTSRDFGNNGSYGISVYGLEKKKMVLGDPNARSVHFFLDSSKVPIATIGDGLLPADVDGKLPADGAPAPVVGTQNILGPYGATSDALNIYNLTVNWPHGTSSLSALIQLPVATFNSTFPCGASGRACIPQPNTTAKVDFLGYRQRPTWRLAFRKRTGYDVMVTNQSVQVSPGVAGVRWYEIRRTHNVYSLFQQGTYAPSDNVDRWMGSAAMDKFGNIALGYSVSDATSTFPGIRYTGRKPTDPPGMMTLREKVMKAGTGSQTTSFNRWGDYSSLNIDPLDDCTFWYVNEYYQTTSIEGWQTRIGSFKLKGC
ncbi:MAG TPA: hypothetical protein VJN22_06285 [Candidatus Eremiobacteraceae bacterium]|nr:hypothetical protein [Candidatus Eremiobacteraceae bacterium]